MKQTAYRSCKVKQSPQSDLARLRISCHSLVSRPAADFANTENVNLYKLIHSLPFSSINDSKFIQEKLLARVRIEILLQFQGCLNVPAKRCASFRFDIRLSEYRPAVINLHNFHMLKVSS